MVDNPRDVPFRGGFVLTRERRDEVAHFRSRDLGHGWALWTDDGCATDIAEADGDLVVVRGHWADLSDDATDEGPAGTLLRLLRTDERAFHERLGKLAGRHVIITLRGGRLRVYHDALGLRSLYYSTTSPLVASHLRLLQRLESHETQFTSKVALTAWDESLCAGVRHLLPNYWLDPDAAEVTRYFPLEPNRYMDWSVDERLSRVEELWHRELEIYAKTHPRTAVSVTGGLDSRLMLAMARNHLPDYEAFTYTVDSKRSPWTRSLHQDGEIVRDLLPFLNVKNHTFMDVEEEPTLPKPLERSLRANAWTKHGHRLIPHYRAAFPESDWIHLRGTGVEVVRRYWPMAAGMTEFEDVIHRLTRSGSPDLRPRGRELGYDRDLCGYGCMDLAYWEVRMGKWHAELLNESDAAFETFVPIATREIFELLLAFNDRDRLSGLAVRELINRNHPVLNFVGANDLRNLYEQRRDEVRALEQVELRGHIVVKADGKKVKPEVRHTGCLSIPRENFEAGATATAVICVTQKQGDLQFTVHNEYESQGRGAFAWAVVVDSQEMIRCDGAASALPARVTLTNVPEGAAIKLRLLALRTLKKGSWQAASVTSVDELTFRKRQELNGQLAAACDSPHAEICGKRDMA